MALYFGLPFAIFALAKIIKKAKDTYKGDGFV